VAIESRATNGHAYIERVASDENEKMARTAGARTRSELIPNGARGPCVRAALLTVDEARLNRPNTRLSIGFETLRTG